MSYTKRGTPFWQRMTRRLVRSELGPCLEWQGAHHPHGYGEFREGGKLVRAHIRAYELTHGPVPTGLMVCHKCDNPPCCEPRHLYAGTAQQNAQDAARQGRMTRKPWKFSDAVIAEARRQRAAGRSLASISDALGIEPSYLSRICRGLAR